MHPPTDIIVLVHNNLPVTLGFVEHLFKNTANFNLIFVDNGSTDGVQQFLQDGADKKRWTLIRSDENLGVIGGRNLGAKYSTADFFLNIDNDQYPGERWLDSLHDLMIQGYDVTGCEAWLMLPPDVKGQVVLNGKNYSRAYFPQKRCTTKSDRFTYIGCGGMLIKREVYEKIGLFDERFNPFLFEDPDFCFRAIRAGYKLGWCYNCKINHLAHQTINNQNLAQKNQQFAKSWRHFQEKWLPYYPDPIKMP